MGDRPFDEAPPGRQVHDVVLVDPGRAGQQRHGMHPLGLRGVLDEFHQVVAEYDVPRRRREVAAKLERGGVYLARPAAVVREVVQEVPRSRQHAGAAGLEGLLQRGRVARQEVGRGQQVEREAHGELRLLIRQRIAAPGGQQVLAEPPGRQVGLPQREVRGVAGPGLIGEPFVPFIRRHRRRHIGPGPAGDRHRPCRGHRRAVPEPGPPSLRRPPGGPRERCQQGRAEVGRIEPGEQSHLRAESLAGLRPGLPCRFLYAHRDLPSAFCPASSAVLSLARFALPSTSASSVRRSRRCPVRRRCTS